MKKERSFCAHTKTLPKDTELYLCGRSNGAGNGGNF